MHPALRDKNVIFFDVGYTLDAPASGDWMLTLKFLELAGERLRQRGEDEIVSAMRAGLRTLTEDHRVETVEKEIRQFTAFYLGFSERLDLGLDAAQAEAIARDRACGLHNYIPYPGIEEVMAVLSRTHRLEIISDTWPGVETQLEGFGLTKYLSFRTYSCQVGAFKPDPRIFRAALAKCGEPAEKTAFIDDVPDNLEGAAALGITPILIAAEPGEPPKTRFPVIRDLRELIGA